MLTGTEVSPDSLMKACAHPLSGHLQSNSRSRLVGPKLLPSSGQGMEFKELRSYQPGDDRRQIHWRASARSQTLQCRVYHEEVDLPQSMVIWPCQSLYFGSKKAYKIVRLLESAALLLQFLLQQTKRVDLFIPLNGQWQRLQLHHQNQLPLALNKLSLLSLAQELPKTPPVHPFKKEGLWLLSDWFAQEQEEQFLWPFFAQYSQGRLIQFSDPLEKELPPPGRYPVKAKQGIKWVRLSSREREQRQIERKNWEQNWSRQLQKRRWQWLEIMSNSDAREELNAWLHQ